MLSRSIAICAALGLFSGGVEGHGHGHHHHHYHHDHDHTTEDAHRRLTGVTRCGTPSPNFAQKMKIEQSLQNHHALFGAPALREQTIVIPIWWHNIRTSNGDGGATQQMFEDQLAVLNEAYSSSGFAFELVGQTESNNDEWWAGPEYGQDAEFSMKGALRQGGSETLNVYTTGIDQTTGILGYAYFPWEYQNFPTLDGVVIGTESMPGGSTFPFNEGDSLVHEVGHWLGLFHVFEGGCIGDGDLVEDTPPQNNATSGCPAPGVQDTCPGDGVDSVTNYMDYSDDSCLEEFTVGQSERMVAIWFTYRQSETSAPTSSPTEPNVTPSPTSVDTESPTDADTPSSTPGSIAPTESPTQDVTPSPTTLRPTVPPTTPSPTPVPGPLVESICSFVLIWVGDVYPCLTTP